MIPKMAHPILTTGGTANEILIGLKRLAEFELSKEQEYICLRILYNLTRDATLPGFINGCANRTKMGITRKQMEIIEPFVENLSEFVW